MEPAQAKPPRKRRRWLIVALLLVLVGGVAWWHWPRGDARFVGKWALYRGMDSDPADLVTLRANGSATLARPDGSSVRDCFWGFSENELSIGIDWGFLPDFVLVANDYRRRHIGREYSFSIDRFTVVDIDDEEILLHQGNSAPSRKTLKRAPE